MNVLSNVVPEFLLFPEDPEYSILFNGSDAT